MGMLMRGGRKGIHNGVQDPDATSAFPAGKSKLRAVAESGNDLRALAVCSDLHVSNSLEILGKSDWETDLASSRARYDAHIQD
jgi:hypothetical protein